MAGFRFESHRLRRRAWFSLGLWAAIALVGYVVIIEHRNHVLDFLPYVLLLVCPLMHLFMHGRHGHHHHHHDHQRDPTSKGGPDVQHSKQENV